MNLRKAMLSDKERILEISAGIWNGGDYIHRVLEDWLRDSSGFLCVCEIDGLVVGFSKLSRLLNESYFLEGIRADARFKNRGVGKAMTQFLMEEAKKKGATKVSLATFIENISSIRLIESFGFEKKCALKYLFREEGADVSAPDFQRLTKEEDWQNFIFEMKKDAYEGLLNFDWTLLRVNEEVLYFLKQRGDIYVHEDTYLIFSKYKSKERGYTLSYAGKDKEKCISYALKRAYQEGESLSWMAKEEEFSMDLIQKYGFCYETDPFVLDVFYYEKDLI